MISSSKNEFDEEEGRGLLREVLITDINNINTNKRMTSSSSYTPTLNTNTNTPWDRLVKKVGGRGGTSSSTGSNSNNNNNNNNDPQPYLFWLEDADIDAEEYNNTSAVDRRILRSQFEKEHYNSNSNKIKKKKTTTTNTNTRKQYDDDDDEDEEEGLLQPEIVTTDINDGDDNNYNIDLNLHDEDVGEDSSNDAATRLLSFANKLDVVNNNSSSSSSSCDTRTISRDQHTILKHTRHHRTGVIHTYLPCSIYSDDEDEDNCVEEEIEKANKQQVVVSDDKEKRRVTVVWSFGISITFFVMIVAADLLQQESLARLLILLWSPIYLCTIYLSICYYEEK